MKNSSYIAPYLAALTVILTQSALAQTQNDELRQAVGSADVIAEAEILDVRARWVEGLVVSTVTARTNVCLRGDCPTETLRYEVLGGRIDGVVQVVSGSTVPRVGQEMVLLLEQGSVGLQLVSWEFGQLPISMERETPQRVMLHNGSISMGELRRIAMTEITW